MSRALRQQFLSFWSALRAPNGGKWGICPETRQFRRRLLLFLQVSMKSGRNTPTERGGEAAAEAVRKPGAGPDLFRALPDFVASDAEFACKLSFVYE
jgi:hypothetical protein